MLTRTWLLPGWPALSAEAETHPNARLGFQPQSFIFVCTECGEAWGVCIVNREPQYFEPVRTFCPRHQSLGLFNVWIDLKPEYNAILPVPLKAEHFLFELDWHARVKRSKS